MLARFGVGAEAVRSVTSPCALAFRARVNTPPACTAVAGERLLLRRAPHISFNRENLMPHSRHLLANNAAREKCSPLATTAVRRTGPLPGIVSGVAAVAAAVNAAAAGERVTLVQT